MIGQEIILDKIKHSTLDTFPRTILLEGALGSGKHSICNIIKDKFNVSLIDITDTLTYDTISNIYFSTEPTIYVIDMSIILSKNKSENKQNLILKLIEEPTLFTYIILLCENKNLLLPTVINRCQVWTLQKYSIEQLKQFNNDIIACEIGDTPGQVLKLKEIDLYDMIDLCTKIYEKIDTANISNILSIPDKVSDKKYDYQMLFKSLMYTISNMYKKVNSDAYLKYYLLTRQLINDSSYLYVNKQRLFEDFLVSLKYDITRIKS